MGDIDGQFWDNNYDLTENGRKVLQDAGDLQRVIDQLQYSGLDPTLPQQIGVGIPTGMSAEDVFCWMCGRNVPDEAQMFDPLIYGWFYNQQRPGVAHFTCAYHRMVPTGHEHKVYKHRVRTNACAHYRCNQRGAVANYPENSEVQRLQMTFDRNNLTRLGETPFVLVPGGEYAYEADALLIPKVVYPHFVSDYSPQCVPMFASIQVKLCRIRRAQNGTLTGTIKLRHHYSRYTKVLIIFLYPNNDRIYCTLDGNIFEDMCVDDPNVFGAHLPKIETFNQVALENLRVVGNTQLHSTVTLTSLDDNGVVNDLIDFYRQQHVSSTTDRQGGSPDRGHLVNMHDGSEVKATNGM